MREINEQLKKLDHFGDGGSRDEPPFLELQSIFGLSIKEARELAGKGYNFVKKALNDRIETLQKSLSAQESIAKGQTPKLQKDGNWLTVLFVRKQE